jgi:alanyl-tRNA synthetase
MKSFEIREKFLKFFEEHGHTIIPGSSLLPEGDTNALFSVAGMQQFKPYFAGVKDPLVDIHPNIMKPLGNINIASVQKCLRTIDIDLVGDNRHLTMFEMLGNFSFGGYFKKEMIPLSFEFVTQVLNISPDKLKISVFAGDEYIPFDQESYDI